MNMTDETSADHESTGEGTPPVVLAASGMDPTGSAGLLADVRVVHSLGCHPCGVVTCETVQSSQGLTGIQPSQPEMLREQLSAILDDLQISAVKIGALASPETIEIIGRALRVIPDVPVVLDPVFEPTRGRSFLNGKEIWALAEQLLGQTLVATPNVRELGTLAKVEFDPDDDEAIVHHSSAWFAAGVEAILVTGLRRDAGMVDRLIRVGPDQQTIVTDIAHPLHAVGEVHGTGCIISSAIAAHLARGEKLVSAIRQASVYTSCAIEKARKFGSGASFWIRSG